MTILRTNNLQSIKYHGLCHGVVILREIYVMRLKCHVRWLRLHFERALITGLGQ